MKKILFTLIVIILLSSCTTDKEEIAFIVKFKDGTEMKIVGTDASVGKNGFYVYHKDLTSSVFAKDEVLYIIRE